MKKRILLLFVCVLVMAALAGCAKDTEAKEATYLEEVWRDGVNSVYVLVDEETGVNYLIFSGYDKGGIVPRYNADGSLYVTSEAANE